MKLTKLLPIATIASVTAVVTPLVTSCGSKWTEFEITENYKFGDQKEGSMTEDEATKIYLQDVSANKKILVDDYINNILQPNNYSEYETHTWLGVGKVDVDGARVSLRSRTKSSGTFESTKIDGVEKDTINNIPLKVVYGTPNGEGLWTVTCTLKTVDDMKADKSWSVSSYYKIYNPETKKYEEDSAEINYKSSKEEISGVLYYMVSLFGLKPSRYLAKVTKA